MRMKRKRRVLTGRSIQMVEANLKPCKGKG
jgi:hypothetical protein